MFEKCVLSKRENEQLHLSAICTGKFELFFFLTQENAFSYRFHFKASKKRIGSSKK